MYINFFFVKALSNVCRALSVRQGYEAAIDLCWCDAAVAQQKVSHLWAIVYRQLAVVPSRRRSFLPFSAALRCMERDVLSKCCHSISFPVRRANSFFSLSPPVLVHRPSNAGHSIKHLVQVGWLFPGRYSGCITCSSFCHVNCSRSMTGGQGLLM